MNAQQLRNSILQMAVQGKLVPQDPNDEPASVLLERIRKEKEKLIKEGKIKKEKNSSYIFRGADNTPYEKIGNNKPVSIANEIPFDIPDSWEWVRLGNIVYNHGQVKPTKRFCYIDIGSIDNEHQRLNDNETILNPEMAPSRARKIVGFGDIIYSTVRPYLHNMCIIDKEFSCSPIASTGFAVLSCRAGIFNKYLFYCLLAPFFNAYANSTENAKGVAYPAITDARLYNALIPVPSLAEQQRIVQHLEKLKPYIQKYNVTEIALKELTVRFPIQLKKSILQLAIQGKLIPQNKTDEPARILLQRIRAEKEKLINAGKIKRDKNESIIFKRDNSYYEKIGNEVRCIDNEIPFEIPDSWEWMRWGTLSESIQYGFNAPAKQTGKIKMVRISDIQNNIVLWDSVPYCDIDDKDVETYMLRTNDILFARTGGTVGKSCLLKNVPTKSIYAGYLIRTRYSKLLVSQYLKIFMDSPLYWCQLNDGTTKTAQPNCNGKTLSKMLIPIPPAAEQHRIVAKIEELLPLIKYL